MDSDADSEEPQNEPGTSSTSQTVLPVLPLHPGPTVGSQGPVASANSDDEASEFCDESCASRLWKDSAPPRPFCSD